MICSPDIFFWVLYHWVPRLVLCTNVYNRHPMANQFKDRICGFPSGMYMIFALICMFCKLCSEAMWSTHYEYVMMFVMVCRKSAAQWKHIWHSTMVMVEYFIWANEMACFGSCDRYQFTTTCQPRPADHDLCVSLAFELIKNISLMPQYASKWKIRKLLIWKLTFY